MYLAGPDLLRNRIGMISRFREQEGANNADIESMFSQVGESRGYCRFLWRNNANEHLHLYEYSRQGILFGSKDLPFKTSYAVQQAEEDFNGEFPKSRKRSNGIFIWTTLSRVFQLFKTHENITDKLYPLCPRVVLL